MFLFNPTISGEQQQPGGDDMLWFVKVNVFIGLPNAISFMLKQSDCENSCRQTHSGENEMISTVDDNLIQIVGNRFTQLQSGG